MKLTNKILNVNNRRTSMRLCCKEWAAIDSICTREHLNRNQLISMIEKAKNQKLGLSYSTRLFALLYYQSAADRQKTEIAGIINELS